MQDNRPFKEPVKDNTKDGPHLRQIPDTNLSTDLLAENFGPVARMRYRGELVGNRLTGLTGRLFDTEREYGLLINLLPVGMAVGIGLYFAAPAEPSLIALILALIGSTAIALRMQFHGKAFVFICTLAVVLLGMSAAKLSTIRNATPMLERQITAVVSGVVLKVDQNRRGSPRLLLKTKSIEGIETGQLPRNIRLSAASGAKNVRPGDQVSGLARMQPISGPAHPGSYDFSFHAWFAGLGGSGFFMGRPDVEPSGSAIIPGQIAINQMRQEIGKRIRLALPDHIGGIAVALVTGDKSGIDQAHQQTLRNTGLAHILAISGLHMALVTLTVIWLFRFGFALMPDLALNYPVKKWAVCAGFVSATIYLFLSGAGIATQRAWIMISVMLLAVMLDRRAITMRSVAFSAMLILLISPQSLLSPGFQMSFAAVASLVAGYEAIYLRKKMRADGIIQPIETSLLERGIKSTSSYVAGLAITSLIAGTATGFIAAWHFNQLAPLGLIANLAAMPVVALIIMPLVMVSMLLMPFGFEAVALVPVSHGIKAMLYLSGEIEKISPSGVVGQLPIWKLGLFAVSLTGLTLFRTRLRLLFLAGFGLIALNWQTIKSPDILVSENGRAIGLIENRVLKLAYPKRNRFVTEIWAKAWTGGQKSSLDLGDADCSRDRCEITVVNGKRLHIVYDPDLIGSSCLKADILIAPRLWWTRCKTRKPDLILNRQDFEINGSHAIYLSDRKYGSPANAGQANAHIIKTGLPNSTRPWARQLQPIEDYFATKRQ